MFDLEGSPSRPGSRQPLVTRPLANGAPPGAPLYPILSEPDIPAAEKKTPDDVVIKILSIKLEELLKSRVGSVIVLRSPTENMASRNDSASLS